MDFNITKYKMFTDVFLDSTLQLTLRNCYFSSFGIVSKKNIFIYLERL